MLITGGFQHGKAGFSDKESWLSRVAGQVEVADAQGGDTRRFQNKRRPGNQGRVLKAVMLLPVQAMLLLVISKTII